MSDDIRGSKQFWESKTFWFNIFVTLSSIGLYFSNANNEPQLTIASIAGTLTGIINIILRIWFTNMFIAH
jgi:hypothetical protein